MDTFADRLTTLQAESQRITQYLHTLPPEALGAPSACSQWQVHDVIAHLIGVAETYAGSVSRGLQGDTAPPAGRPPAGTANAAVSAEGIAQRSIATRQRLGDQLLTTFDTTSDHLNCLLAGLDAQQRDIPCYHPGGMVPARRFMDLRLKELALHEWDIRAGLEPNAALSAATYPAMLDLIADSIASGSLRWAFWAGPRLPRAVRYRFLVTGVGPDKSDIVVTGDSISMDEARDTLADVTFHCDTETYLLLVYGRLSPEAAMASGRLVVVGDQEMALAFGRWFKGL